MLISSLMGTKGTVLVLSYG